MDPLFHRSDLINDPTVNSNFQSILTALGIYGPVKHLYEPLILPVAVVAQPAPALGVKVKFAHSNGPATAPAATTLLADTSRVPGDGVENFALPAITIPGDYDIIIPFGAGENTRFQVVMQSPSGGPQLWGSILFALANQGYVFGPIRQTFFPSATNSQITKDRMYIANVPAGGVGVIYVASILANGPF